MIGNAAQVYQRSLQKLADIESRCAVADAYCMRLVMANSRNGQANMLTELLPLGTPFESLYTQAGLEAVFAPFMQDISLIAGSAPTVDPEPQDAKSALLTTLPIALSAIRDLLGGIGPAVMGYSEIDTVLADTAGLADNVATLIRAVGWQFAWPICLGSFRNSAKMTELTASVDAGAGQTDELVISHGDGSAQLFGASGMSNWDKPRENDVLLVVDMSAVTAYEVMPDTLTVSAVETDFKNVTFTLPTTTNTSEDVDSAALTLSESLGTIYLRKISTP